MTENKDIKAILFVCMGNICRSPTAEGVVRELLRREAPDLRLDLDSAGTHSYHIGHPPDARSVAAARNRGIDLSGLRARKVSDDDFSRFDLVLAMDRDNLEEMEAFCAPELRSRLRLFMSYAVDTEIDEVPDPYYGGDNGFEQVLDLIEAAGRGLIEALRGSARSASKD